jgi:hypothetical protein
MRKFLRTTIRYFLFIAVGLFGITHELVKSETRRVPLIGGYVLVIGASIFGIWRRSLEDDDDEDERD